MVSGLRIKKEFLENEKLYHKIGCALPQSHRDLEGDKINLYCNVCKSIQTFVPGEVVFNGVNTSFSFKGKISSAKNEVEDINGFLTLDYGCANCGKEGAIYLIKIYKNQCEKVGQYPPLDISIPSEIKLLNDQVIIDLYKKGKSSENFSYGIGAFVYYRRIIELKIDDLLNRITEYFPETKINEYKEILEKVKREKNADKKIEIVKNIISDEIIPNNPLKSLYDILSKGIHKLSDEDCLESASAIRTLLLMLITEIELKKENKNKLISAQKIIDKLRSK